MIEVLEPLSPTEPYQRLDGSWINRVRRSGWQGWTLLAGGEDVMDQAVLFWLEGREAQRSLHLTLRVRQDANANLLARMMHLPGRVAHASVVPYPRKQIVAGEVYPLGQEWVLPGSAVDVRLGTHLTVRYLPYETEAETTPFSAQGLLTATLDPAHARISETHAILAALSRDLGMNTRLSTPIDLEILYLRKMAFALRLESSELEERLRYYREKPPIQMLQAAQRWMSAQVGEADVTRLATYDWRPHFGSAYNPWAGQVGKGRAGWPHWYRFDVDPGLFDGRLGRCYLGHDLGAQAQNVGDRVARIIRTTGYLLSSEERWMRLGTPSQSIFLPDGQAGGGAFVPLRLCREPDQAALVFDPHLLRRLDHIAVDLGRPKPGTQGLPLSPSLVTDRLTLDHLSGSRWRSAYVYLKRGVALLDSLLRINVDKDGDRVRVLDALRTLGVTRVRDLPVEELVRVRAG